MRPAAIPARRIERMQRHGGWDAPYARVTPRIVEQALGVRVVQARAALEEIERETKRLADPQQRHAALSDLPDPAADDAELEDLSALAEIFNDLESPRRPAARKRKQKRRRRYLALDLPVRVCGATRPSSPR
jgi:hypothetical protein